jgi:hypothetical protein
MGMAVVTAITIITQDQLTPVMEAFGQEAALLAQKETHAAFPGGWLQPSVVMALGLRETGLRNIRGGAVLINGVWEPSDTDEGWLQITNTVTSNAEWLAKQPGCPNGSWKPDMPGFNSGKVNALTTDHNPTLTAALGYTLGQITSERRQAYSVVHPSGVLRFVIAAHNAGFEGALEGYRAGNVDENTTLGNYSAWVLANAPAIAEWIAGRPDWQWKGA